MPENLQHTTLAALIKMLDDPDDRVYAVISDKLLSFGREAILPLEKAMENCFDEAVEERMKTILDKIHQANLFNDLSLWLQSGAEEDRKSTRLNSSH